MHYYNVRNVPTTCCTMYELTRHYLHKFCFRSLFTSSVHVCMVCVSVSYMYALLARSVNNTIDTRNLNIPDIFLLASLVCAAAPVVVTNPCACSAKLMIHDVVYIRIKSTWGRHLYNTIHTSKVVGLMAAYSSLCNSKIKPSMSKNNMWLSASVIKQIDTINVLLFCHSANPMYISLIWLTFRIGPKSLDR